MHELHGMHSSPSAMRNSAPLFVALAAMFGACDAAMNDAESTAEAIPSLQEFLDESYREPFAGGVFIVNGDTPVENTKKLAELYYQIYPPDGALIIARGGGGDLRWPNSNKRALSYCVSDTFGSRKADVTAAMRSATLAWEAVADVDFHHLAAQDSSCTAHNGAVVFDVRPVSGAPYSARAFFPGQSRITRNVLVDSSALFSGQAFLTGILRHELGHALGFVHEHTRPEAGRCFEGGGWREVTPYDRGSVMHYPQCGGTNPALEISALDATGAEAIYGPPAAGGDDAPQDSPQDSPQPGETCGGVASGALSAGQTEYYGPISVTPGGSLFAELEGTGDADLYVRYGQRPTATEYDCRPYRDGSNESCALDNGSSTLAWIAVDGFAAASYSLDVTWSCPSSARRPGGDPSLDPDDPPLADVTGDSHVDDVALLPAHDGLADR